MPRLTTEQREMYADFVAEFWFCWACGFEPSRHIWPRDWHFSRLDNAHIVGGQGRRPDRRDIVRLCHGCHLLSHGETVRIEGKLLPHLTRANLVWLKSIYDPEHYDRDYMDGLTNFGRIEDPEPLPGWFSAEFQRLGPVELRQARAEFSQ